MLNIGRSLSCLRWRFRVRQGEFDVAVAEMTLGMLRVLEYIVVLKVGCRN